MPSTRAIPVRLPDSHLPHANWADAFEIDIPDKRLTALEAARLSLGRIPPWAKRLMAIRNAFAGLVGLKTGSEPSRPGGFQRGQALVGNVDLEGIGPVGVGEMRVGQSNGNGAGRWHMSLPRVKERLSHRAQHRPVRDVAASLCPAMDRLDQDHGSRLGVSRP